MRRFEGRRVVVTGASRGIGVGIAHRLAAEGANIAVVARTVDHHDHLRGSLTETVELLRSFGGTAVAIAADLGDEASRATIIPAAVEALGGPIEILVNNAAAAIYQGLRDYPLRRRRLMFELNVHAPLDLAQAVIPAMEAAGEGWIVNLSSGSARLPAGPPFETGGVSMVYGLYGATKAALNRMTAALAAELYGTGIRVNTIEPRAAVLSEGAVAVMKDTLRPDQIESMEEMAEGAVWLCACPADHTGRIEVSLDVIAREGLAVRPLGG